MADKRKRKSPLQKAPGEYSPEEITALVKEILCSPFWIPELCPEEAYTRLHDDHDGTFKGSLTVAFSKNGDAWLYTDQSRGASLRFRTQIGGGQSERVRTALMILAFAIKLDNESRPNNK